MSMLRRTVLTVLAGATLAAALPALAQTAFPSRPVRLIVGFPPGTGPDIVARLLARKLSEGWGGQAVVVDNKPGAAGLIAATEAARAAPDGHTLMLGETGQLSIAPSTYNKLPYDPVKDFVPVSQVVTADFVLLVNPQKVPARTVKEYIDWARQQKDGKGLFMATFGAGTPGHFGAHLFGEAAHIKPEPVHFRSTGDAMTAIFSGDVQGVFASAGLAQANVRSGKLAALAATGAQRIATLPEVPTFREQGLPNLVFNSWFGIVTPARTPADIVAKLNADIVRAMRSPDGQKQMEDAGFRVTATSAAEFTEIIAADTRSWGKAVAATGFKAD
jgi:tripartite-type tricarboxylate transporter receptor subunit TctC